MWHVSQLTDILHLAAREMREWTPRVINWMAEELQRPYIEETAVDLFVCYASADGGDAARQIVMDFEKRGVKCWIAPRDVMPGASWPNAIVNGIELCRAMLLVVTDKANSSPEIEKEIGLANHLRKVIFPVRLDDVTLTGTLRYQTQNRQWRDLFSNREDVLDEISEQIRLLRDGGRDPNLDFLPIEAVMQSAPLVLPARPSIAVLPFANIGGDPEQEYFADGITEDIITALSQFKSLFVIARNSGFTYKGKAVDIKQVGRELGVRYVLEGSVRKSGNRMRITGQLVEAATGVNLWAEKIDGALEDVFELQDEVTSRVAGAIEPSITQAEINRARVKPTKNLDAYDCYLRALPPFYQITREGNNVAIGFVRRAIALDPGYALAKAFLAAIHVARWLQGWGEAGDAENGMALALEAIADDPNDPSVLRLAGHTLSFWGDYDHGLTLLEKAARLNVNGSQVLSSLGWVMVYACVELDRAIQHFERAMRLSPRDPEIGLMLNGIALAHLIAGRAPQALSAAQKGIDGSPGFGSVHRNKIAALVELGRLQDAKAAAATFLAFDPSFTIRSRLPKFRDAVFQQRYYSALQAAGLPE
jgi:adenylate cyclase